MVNTFRCIEYNNKHGQLLQGQMGHKNMMAALIKHKGGKRSKVTLMNKSNTNK